MSHSTPATDNVSWSEADNKPLVSIIIPTYNEEGYIALCLDSVVGQTYPRDLMEVFVVDGGSTDNTRRIVRHYASLHPFIRLLDNPRRIVPAGLNVGVAASSGEAVIRLDAHARYDKSYISTCVDTLSAVDAANVGGPIRTLPGAPTAVARAIALATSHPFGVGNSKFRTSRKAAFVDTVTYGAFRRNVFERVGMFDERLVRNQDIEFNARIRRSGGRIYLNPDIKSYYYNRPTLRELWQQNFNNGRWNIFTEALCGHSLSARHFVPLIFVAGLTVSALLALFHPAGVITFGIVAGSWSTASVFSSVLLASKHDPIAMLYLPLVFGTLHVSYGLGSLFGLIQLSGWKRRMTT